MSAQTMKEQAMIAAEESGWSCQQDKFYPGKFEGEPWYAPYFWQCALEGAGDEPFYHGETVAGDVIPVDAEEREAFELAPQTAFVAVWYSEQGFVSLQELTTGEYDKTRAQYDSNIDEEG